MTIENFLSVAAYLGALFILTPILGTYMAHALSGERVFLSPVLLPIERLIYRVALIDPKREMHWKKYASTVLVFSVLGILLLFILQVLQGRLPFNPQEFGPVAWPLALNTAVSFVTNTNWQAYSGESTLSYFVQSLGLTTQNFMSAAVGIAVLLAFIRGLTRKNSGTIGNFWADMVRSVLYVLLPLSFILAILLMSQGVVQTFSSYVAAETLEGSKQVLPMGPAASQVAIKQLGTNGGGFFGTNSAHPFENPTPLSNFLQMLALLLIPSALIYMFGL
ncbi:MAG TPA: potassium-transporting ATPase subunit KdpA, partial [Myxococcota bacterium]|nr:potassium-transporting ATPase subunit KdpA [Myxococcota bacterium]